MAIYTPDWRPPTSIDPGGGRRWGANAMVKEPSRFVIVEAQSNATGLVFLPLPYPDFVNNLGPGNRPTRCWPDRLSEDPGARSHFIFSCRGARKTGPDGETFIFDEPSAAEVGGYAADADHPYNLVLNACIWSRRQPVANQFGDSNADDWYGLVSNKDAPPAAAPPAPYGYGYQSHPGYQPPAQAGGSGGRKFRYLQTVQKLSFIFCVVFADKDGVYHDRPRGVTPAEPLPVAMLTANAVDDLISKMNELADPHAGATAGAYKIQQLSGVWYVNAYDSPQGSMLEHARNHSLWNLSRRGQPPPRTIDRSQRGYRVYLSQTHNGEYPAPHGTGQPADYNRCVQLALEKCRPWNEVLVGLTNDQVAAKMALWGLPNSLLAHAWRMHPEYLPHQLRVAAVSTSVAAHPPGPYAPGFQQPPAYPPVTGWGAPPAPQPPMAPSPAWDGSPLPPQGPWAPPGPSPAEAPSHPWGQQPAPAAPPQYGTQQTPPGGPQNPWGQQPAPAAPAPSPNPWAQAAPPPAATPQAPAGVPPYPWAQATPAAPPPPDYTQPPPSAATGWGSPPPQPQPQPPYQAPTQPGPGGGLWGAQTAPAAAPPPAANLGPDGSPLPINTEAYNASHASFREAMAGQPPDPAVAREQAMANAKPPQ